jgi:hypothetical protein
MPAETGAPETEEIEITPEMIRAGVAALFEFDSRFASEDECVSAIFRAMARSQTKR